VRFAAVPAIFADRRQPLTDNAVAGRIDGGKVLTASLADYF
jgi:hypothetical protein